MDTLLQELASAFGTRPDLIAGHSRAARNVEARVLLYVILNWYWGWTVSEIEREFGINHCTLCSGRKTFISYYKYDPEYRKKADSVIENL